MRCPPLLGIAAPSGTGKSTVIVGLVEVLSARGLSVGVLKHDAHRLSFDKHGKDTFRFRRAGAVRAVISGDHEVAVFSAPDPSASDPRSLSARWFADMDLVIVEGYRQADLPWVRVHRHDGPPTDTWTPPAPIVGWFTDAVHDARVPSFPLGDYEVQADFVLEVLGIVPAIA